MTEEMKKVKREEEQQLLVEKVIQDGRFQQRVAVNPKKVVEYAELMRDEEIQFKFKPIRVHEIEGKYYVVDGFHRLQAAISAAQTHINALVVRDSTVADATLDSIVANSEHGLPRTRADKAKAVFRLLAYLNDGGQSWSDSRIARQCGCTHPFVAGIRKQFNAGKTYEDVARKKTKGESIQEHLRPLIKFNRTVKSATNSVESVAELLVSTGLIPKLDDETVNDMKSLRLILGRILEAFEKVAHGTEGLSEINSGDKASSGDA